MKTDDQISRSQSSSRNTEHWIWPPLVKILNMATPRNRLLGVNSFISGFVFDPYADKLPFISASTELKYLQCNVIRFFSLRELSRSGPSDVCSLDLQTPGTPYLDTGNSTEILRFGHQFSFSIFFYYGGKTWEIMSEFRLRFFSKNHYIKFFFEEKNFI